MATTKCPVTKGVIAALGTTPQERGLETPVFKAKFDQEPDGIIDYINNTLTVEVDTHLAETTSQQLIVTRDISLTGVQTVSGLLGAPKRIEIRAVITNWASLMLAIGSWEKSETKQSCNVVFNYSSGYISYNNNLAIIQAFTNSDNYLTGSIQNVVSGQFEINWASYGSPTGTLNMQITAYYHG